MKFVRRVISPNNQMQRMGLSAVPFADVRLNRQLLFVEIVGGGIIIPSLIRAL